MKVLFLTKRLDHTLNGHPRIKATNDCNEAFNYIDSQEQHTGDKVHYKAWKIISHDIETQTEFPQRSGLLLSAFTINSKDVLVVDNTSVDNGEVFSKEYLYKAAFVAHNSDFESRWGITCSFMPSRYFCTMVNDRRLLSGADGYRFDIVSVINRRLGNGAQPDEMSKDIRSQFATCTYFTDEQILYNAADTIRLKDIYYKQLEEAEKLGQSFLHKTINSRIIIPIAKAEVTGIKHDSEKWISIAKDREEKANKLCQELTEIIINQYKVDLEKVNPMLLKQRLSLEKKDQKKEVRIAKLQEQLRKLEVVNKTHLKSYSVTTLTLDKLLSTEVKSGERQLTNVSEITQINWGSSKQVLEILRQIGCPLPLARDKKSRGDKEGLGKEHISNWITEYTDSNEFYPIIKLYKSYKGLIHNVRSFGEQWIKQYVRNGRAYTMFNSAGAATGRWTSGSRGKDKKYMNISQIPGDKEYRSCFLADEGRLLVTCDYKNQEGVTAISLSGDMKMKGITEMSDGHSYLATKAWRAVYQDRFNKTKDIKWKELADNFTIDQSTPENIKLRSKHKNSGGLFPTLYGSGASKVSATAGITIEEGQLMLDAVKEEVPGAMLFLDTKSEEALKYGYVIHNTRTNSRRWFTPILDEKHYGFKVSKSDKVAIEMAARNTGIQGTGSCMFKEAVAMIDLYASLYKQDIQFVLGNYDEGVFSIPSDQLHLADKIKSLMERAANNYLIKEVRMKCSMEIKPYWSK